MMPQYIFTNANAPIERSVGKSGHMRRARLLAEGGYNVVWLVSFIEVSDMGPI